MKAVLRNVERRAFKEPRRAVKGTSSRTAETWLDELPSEEHAQHMGTQFEGLE